jgi:hypothetical protein
VKKLRKLDLDLMERELQVLSERETELIIGGDVWEWVRVAILDVIGYEAPALGVGTIGPSVYSDYSVYTICSMSRDEFINKTALNVLSTAPMGNLVGTAISNAAQAVSELEVRLKNYFNYIYNNPSDWTAYPH